MPSRIRRSRAKGSRLPPGAVCISRGTRWGNPWPVEVYGRAESLRRFRNAVEMPLLCEGNLLGFDPADVINLRGKVLACWCKIDESCHGDILIEIANRPLKLACEAA